MNNASFITLSKDLGLGSKKVETYSRKMGYTHHTSEKTNSSFKTEWRKNHSNKQNPDSYLPELRDPQETPWNKPWWLSGLHKEAHA